LDKEGGGSSEEEDGGMSKEQVSPKESSFLEKEDTLKGGRERGLKWEGQD